MSKWQNCPTTFLQRGVIETFARYSAVLELLPFMEIAGNSYKYKQEQTLPGIAFRAVNDAYTESAGVINQKSEGSFCKWAYVVAETLDRGGGEKFLQAYNENIIKSNDEAITANPIATAVIVFMADKDKWKGTATELLNALERVGALFDLFNRAGLSAI